MTTTPKLLHLPAWKVAAIANGATQFRMLVEPQPEITNGIDAALRLVVKGPPYQIGDVLALEDGTQITIKDIRCEKVNQISEDDARAEGVRLEKNCVVDCHCANGLHTEIYADRYSIPESEELFEYAEEAFESLWDIQHPGTWDSYVWVFEIERVG